MSRKIDTHPADKFCQKILSRYPDAIELADTVRRDRARFGEDCYQTITQPLHPHYMACIFKINSQISIFMFCIFAIFVI
jgi:hypothetical protein